MELLFLRDAYGLAVPAIPDAVHPASRLNVPTPGGRDALGSRLGACWASALDSTRQMPSQALLAYHIFETGDFGPLARSLPANPPASCSVDLDTEAFMQWRASVPPPAAAGHAPASDEYTGARLRARLRGLTVLVVLPVREQTITAPPSGVLVISDEIYTQPHRLLRALTDYAAKGG